MRNIPIPPWPDFTREEADAVHEVLLSNRVNYWTGEECREFEKEFAGWVGVEHAVALSNGTVALEAALKALGVGQGDEVVVSPRTFIASASSIVNAGAVPVFADVDRDSQNITVETIDAVLSPKTRAIICVHLAGWPCDMGPIMELAASHDLYVIEDCAQAHGATYQGRSVGAIGHIGAWSFCQDKILTTGGEGGMITTNSRELWSRVWSYKDHGKSWEAACEEVHPPGFRWLHHGFGTNGRMTEVQAVIGRIQLKRLATWAKQRRGNARVLNERLSGVPGVRTTLPPAHVEHAYYKYYAFVEPNTLAEGWARDRIMSEMAKRELPCQSGVCPEVYLERAFRDVGLAPSERLPIARELGETSLMFPVHPGLEARHMEWIAEALTEVMRKARR